MYLITNPESSVRKFIRGVEYGMRKGKTQSTLNFDHSELRIPNSELNGGLHS